jgi:hypothetical protein
MGPFLSSRNLLPHSEQHPSCKAVDDAARSAVFGLTQFRFKETLFVNFAWFVGLIERVTPRVDYYKSLSITTDSNRTDSTIDCTQSVPIPVMVTVFMFYFPTKLLFTKKVFFITKTCVQHR